MILHIFYQPIKKKEHLFNESLRLFQATFDQIIDEVKFVPYEHRKTKLIAVVLKSDDIDEQELQHALSTILQGCEIEEFVFQR